MQTWYDVVDSGKNGVSGGKVLVKEAAWGYMEPNTHVHVKECLTFATGKGISIAEENAK